MSRAFEGFLFPGPKIYNELTSSLCHLGSYFFLRISKNDYILRIIMNICLLYRSFRPKALVDNSPECVEDVTLCKQCYYLFIHS